MTEKSKTADPILTLTARDKLYFALSRDMDDTYNYINALVINAVNGRYQVSPSIEVQVFSDSDVADVHYGALLQIMTVQQRFRYYRELRDQIKLNIMEFNQDTK